MRNRFKAAVDRVQDVFPEVEGTFADTALWFAGSCARAARDSCRRGGEALLRLPAAVDVGMVEEVDPSSSAVWISVAISWCDISAMRMQPSEISDTFRSLLAILMRFKGLSCLVGGRTSIATQSSRKAKQAERKAAPGKVQRSATACVALVRRIHAKGRRTSATHAALCACRGAPLARLPAARPQSRKPIAAISWRNRHVVPPIAPPVAAAQVRNPGRKAIMLLIAALPPWRTSVDHRHGLALQLLRRGYVALPQTPP